MMKIKVCGLTDPLNVLAVAKAEPDYMGFIFYSGSSRFVGTEPDRRLFSTLRYGAKKVGVFVDEEINKMLAFSVTAGLEIVQLHGNESVQICSELKSSGLVVIKSFNIDKDFGFEPLIKYLPVCDYFLFDTKSEFQGGSGKKFNWSKLEEYTLDKPFFLSGGIGPDDWGAIEKISNRAFYAVDINSRFETAPGIKDASLVKKFINDLKTYHI
jgi:phosphoribosylanthranilate isomerase